MFAKRINLISLVNTVNNPSQNKRGALQYTNKHEKDEPSGNLDFLWWDWLVMKNSSALTAWNPLSYVALWSLIKEKWEKNSWHS